MTSDRPLKIVVEGPSDAQLIRAILGDEIATKVRFYAAQGQASLATVGRNILYHDGGPVLLVMDSDTLSPRLTAELESLSLAAMSGPVTSGMPLPDSVTGQQPLFNVFAFVPEIEAVFFEAPDALTQVLGKKASGIELKEGHIIPREVMKAFFGDTKLYRDYQGLLSHLDSNAKHALAAGPQAAKLKTIVETLLADEP
jgi:hypothetical protein